MYGISGAGYADRNGACRIFDGTFGSGTPCDGEEKADVMDKERQYFVYGNEELNVPGCVKNGIQESVANKIFDDMVDFANYAFNKSHAAVYAVVAYQDCIFKDLLSG